MPAVKFPQVCSKSDQQSRRLCVLEQISCSGKSHQLNEQNVDWWVCCERASENQGELVHKRYPVTLNIYHVYNDCGLDLQMRSNYANKNTMMRGTKETSCCLPSKLQGCRDVGGIETCSLLIEKGHFVVCYAKINSNYWVKIKFQSCTCKLIMTQQFDISTSVSKLTLKG